MGLARGISGKDSACQCRTHKRHGFDLWVGKIPWSRKWQPRPVFLPGKFQTEELGGLQFTGSQRVKMTENACIYITAMPWFP